MGGYEKKRAGILRLNKGVGVWFRREAGHGKAEKGMGDSL